MAKLDLTKYGITGTTEVVHNPSYEQRAGAGEQNVDGFHGSFPYVSPRQRGKSIIYIQNQYSISKVPLPLKRFF